MQTYLVETYLPRGRASELRASVMRLSSAFGAPAPAGDVRYVRSTFVPEDEVCFHVFEATSAEAVRRVEASSSLTFDRIVLAEELSEHATSADRPNGLTIDRRHR
jgi:hypothetical protein